MNIEYFGQLKFYYFDKKMWFEINIWLIRFWLCRRRQIKKDYHKTDIVCQIECEKSFKKPGVIKNTFFM